MRPDTTGCGARVPCGQSPSPRASRPGVSGVHQGHSAGLSCHSGTKTDGSPTRGRRRATHLGYRLSGGRRGVLAKSPGHESRFGGCPRNKALGVTFQGGPSLLPRLLLHSAQEATTFSNVSGPSLLSGMMWSTVASLPSISGPGNSKGSVVVGLKERAQAPVALAVLFGHPSAQPWPSLLSVDQR